MAFALGAWLAFAAGFGLFASVLCRRAFSACALAFAGLCSVLFAPGIVEVLVVPLFHRGLGLGGVAGFLQAACETIEPVHPLRRVIEILVSGTATRAVALHEVIWLGAGAALGLVAWRLFAGTNRDEPAVRAATKGSRHVRRLLRPRLRDGRDPVAWRDYYFVAGGKVFLWARVTIYLLAAAFQAWIIYDQKLALRQSAGLMCFFGGLVIFWCELTLLAGRIFAVETRRRTWSSLMTLPMSLARIVFSKVKAILRVLWLSIAVSVLGVFLLADRGFVKLVKKVIFDESEGVWVLAAVILYLIFHPLLVAYLSLRIRWGATALSIGVEFIAWCIFVLSVSIVTQRVDTDVLLPLVCLLLLGAGTILVGLLRRRLRYLAGQ